MKGRKQGCSRCGTEPNTAKARGYKPPTSGRNLWWSNPLACGWYQTARNAWPGHISVSPVTAIALLTKALKQQGDNLHVQHSKRQDWKTSKPAHCSLMWKAHLQAPSLSDCRWAPQTQCCGICLFLALWILDYLTQWSSLRFEHQFYPPSSQWIALSSPHAAKLPTYLSNSSKLSLLITTNPAMALKEEKTSVCQRIELLTLLLPQDWRWRI